MLTIMLDGGDGGGGIAQGATTLVADTWYHLAGTWDGTTANVYVNGILDGTVTHNAPISTDTRDIYIGGRPGTDEIDGFIDDVRVYDEALKPGHVWQLANGYLLSGS